MLIAKIIIITMIYGFVMVGLKDAQQPIKNRLKIMFSDFDLGLFIKKKAHDGDYNQQRRAPCWTNAPLTSPTNN